MPSSAYEVIVGDISIHGDPTTENEDTQPVRSPDYVAYLYPDGSYYSVNHQACTCHAPNHTPSTSCNCGRYYYYLNGYDNSGGSGIAYQCVAFAKFCFYQYNGIDVFHKPDDATNETGINLNTSNLYSVLQSIGSSAYLRGLTPTSNGSVMHSIFLVGFTSSTVTIWHSNYGGPCKVENKTLTYSEFLTRMNRLDWYYTSDGDYVDL